MQDVAVKKLLIVLATSIALLGCSGTGSETRSAKSKETTTSTIDPNNPLDCPEDGINYGCPTAPIDPEPEIDYDALVKECQRTKFRKPTQVAADGVDSWESPGVITTAMDFDSDGNIVVTGLFSDERDFDITSGHKTVGVDEWIFSFIAKFDRETNFLWIKCLGVGELFRWYIGPVINTDIDGNIYHCDQALSKYSPDGKYLWSASGGESTFTCATNQSGDSVLVGSDITLIDQSGRKKWSLPNRYFYAAAFDEQGNILVGSDQELAKFTSTGKELWSIPFKGRNREFFSPNGVTEYGDSSQITNQVGVRADKDGNVLFTFSLNLKNDFDPTSKVRNLTPGWLQDVAIAKYSPQGKLLWAHIVQIPKATPTSQRYVEGYDISVMPSGDIVVLGGGWGANVQWARDQLFLAKFSPEGDQLKFMWVNHFDSFIHNMGHHIITNKNGRTYVTSSGEPLPPFLVSRDL